MTVFKSPQPVALSKLVFAAAILGLAAPCADAAVSAAAESTAAIPPTIVAGKTLQNTAVHRGKQVSFSVSALGTQPFSFQWFHEKQALTGQTNSSLTIVSAQPEHEGDYAVEVRNEGGSALSAPARLYVVPPTPEFKLQFFTNAIGALLPFYLFVPPSYSRDRKYPVACFFHGYGGDQETLPGYFESWPTMFALASYRQQALAPTFVVWPTNPAGRGDYTAADRTMVLQLLDYMVDHYNLDQERIYTGGASAGEDDAWDTIGLRPHFFAGALLWDGWIGSTTPSKIAHVPIWAFGGAGTHASVTRLRVGGGNPLSTEFANAGHAEAIWAAQCTPASWNWLLAQRRGQPARNAFVVRAADASGSSKVVTAESSINISGTTQTEEAQVITLVWENYANRVKGTAATVTNWSVQEIPLAADRTNAIVFTATLNTSWAPAFGGTTLFSETVSVISSKTGLVDESFDPVLSGVGGPPSWPGIVDIALGGDGKIILGGHGFSVEGIPQNGLGRLNSDGALDSTFRAQPLPESGIDAHQIFVQPDGKIWAGWHDHFRYAASGEFDTNINSRIGGLNLVGVDSQGNLLAGAGPLKRFSPDGLLDASFSPPKELNVPSDAVAAVQADGKILVTTESGLERLEINGAEDPTFSKVIVSGVADLHIHTNTGKILISGNFTNVNGVARNGVARINPDGSLDQSYVPPATPRLESVGTSPRSALQPDGRLVVGHTHMTSRPDGKQVGRVFRLRVDGSLEGVYPFEPSGGTHGGYIYDLVLQPDGKLLVCGDFTTVNGTPRNGFVRLQNGPLAVLLRAGNPTSTTNGIVEFQITGAGSQRILIQRCTDLETSWETLTTNVLAEGMTTFRDTNSPGNRRRFYRAVGDY